LAQHTSSPLIFWVWCVLWYTVGVQELSSIYRSCLLYCV